MYGSLNGHRNTSLRPLSFKKNPLKKKILHIEDDYETRELVKTILIGVEEFDFNIVGVKNGLEGLSYLALHKDVDLIILDLMMPDMDGEDFLSGLRETNKNMLAQSPILITTGYDFGKSTANEFKTDFLAKPFRIERLEAKVKLLLGRTKALTQF